MKRTVKILALALLVFAVTLCFASCDMLSDIFGGGSDHVDEGLVDDKFCADGNHSWRTEEYREPYCLEDGYELKTCDKCGMKEQKYLDRLGHDIKVEEGYEPTCSEYGRTDRRYCDRCGDTLEGGESIEPTHQHIPVTVEGYPATCTEDGLTDGEKCSQCDMTITDQYIIYAGHNYVVTDAIDATCTQDGYTEGEACSVCGHVSIAPIKVPGGHQYVDVSGYAATCTTDGLTDGKQCSVCKEWAVEQTVIKAGHTPKVVAGTPATCLSAGLSDGSACDVCGETIVEQTVIAKLKHTPKIVSGYAATCNTNGLTEGIVCSTCSKPLTTQHTITATGHSFGTDGKCKGCELTATADLTYAPVYETSLFALLSTEDTPVAYTVSGLTAGSTATEIIVPNTYNSLPVTGIDAGAFEGNTNIKTVVLPETIVSVGENAFYGCTALESVECADFAQAETWNEYWYGDMTNLKINAPLSGGKTPYDIYIEALKQTNTGLTNYTVNTQQYQYTIADGDQIIDSYMGLEQKQAGNDCYVYQKQTQYADGGNNVSESELYYVDEYLYQAQKVTVGNKTYDYVKVPYSFEWWLGEMTVNRTDLPEFTAEYFVSVEFTKNIDGSMHLTLDMDKELIMAAIAGILKDEFGDMAEAMAMMQFTDLIYEYEFDANGNITMYSADATLMINADIPDSNGVIHHMGMRTTSVSTFKNVGTTTVYAPYNCFDNSEYMNKYCPNDNHSHIVEVEGVEANCFMDGMSDFSYCKTCGRTVKELVITEAAHNYKNGECTVCGEFENENTSEGLAYVLNDDETGYILVGIGTCDDLTVYVPQSIYGLPVLTINADAFEGTNVEFIYINNTSYGLSAFEGIEDTTSFWN